MTLAIIVVALPGLKPLFDRRTPAGYPVETIEINHDAKAYSSDR
jgi:hypothetical protein